MLKVKEGEEKEAFVENKEDPWKQSSAVQTDRGGIHIRTSRKNVQSWLKRNESSKIGKNRDAGSLEEVECKQRSKFKPKILGKTKFLLHFTGNLGLNRREN